MDGILSSLAVGVSLIVMANLLLFRFSPRGAAHNAGIVALASLGIYLPIALLNWSGGDVLAIHLAVYLIACYACSLFLGVRQRAMAQGELAKRRWHWGPAVLVGFFIFLVVVDAVFVFLAERGLPPWLSGFAGRSEKITSAFPGVISHDFQQKEGLYNEYLQQLKRQQKRGWQVRKGWLQKPVMGQPAVFKVVAQTREGEPLVGADVTGEFLRPADSRLDLAFSMRELEPGTYEASVNLPAPGMWDLILRLRKDAELHEIRATTTVLAP